jgi:hypothetical protein
MITDFQLSLIAAGGVFVVGVISYNKWQEYKLKKRVERAFDGQHDDVLMRSDDGVRAEPTFHMDDVPMPDAGSGAYAVPEHVGGHVGNVAAPSIAPDSGAAAGGAEAAAAPVRSADAGVPAEELATCLVDPLIDCLLPLELEAPARGEKLLPALQKLRFVGNKPVHFIGLAVSGDWEPVRHGVVYTRLQGGVQLASRSTALNELEYSELVTRLRSVADEIGAEPQIPDMIEVMQDAMTRSWASTWHPMARHGISQPCWAPWKSWASTCARMAAMRCRTARAATCSRCRPTLPWPRRPPRA